MITLYEYNPNLITVEVIPVIDLKPQVPDALWSKALDHVLDQVQPLPTSFFTELDSIMSGDIYQQLLKAASSLEDIDTI